MKPDLSPSFFPVTCDSSKITPDATFVACDGSRFRGIDFIPQALEFGAKHIVADEIYRQELKCLEAAHPDVVFTYTQCPRKALAELAAAAYDFPAKKLRFIGITGTKGKSTITHMIVHILQQAGHKTALIGGVANKIMDTAVQSSLTTPNSDFLQAFLASCVEQGVNTVVMEVSSHALSLDRVHGIEFDAIGFTNLANDHLDYHKTMEEYFGAKALIFKQVKSRGHAIINLDHPWGAKADQAAHDTLKPEQIISISQTTPATHTMTINSCTLEGLDITIDDSKNQPLHLTSNRLIGSPYAYNMAMAALISQACGVTPNVIEHALLSFPGTPGRMQLHQLKNGARVFVDFAHSGPAMEAVLEMLRPLTNNLIVLFGCGGDKPKERRYSMPRAAATFGDHVIITEDNPRTEDRWKILHEVEANIPPDAKVKTVTIQDRRQAIAAAIALATTPKSIVAILGKGHEPYQIIGTTYHHFDDYEEVLKFK
jgi:UDP-N-acetylmuramoyl-L-alanyl-D-glutamate--2,6-diaminopimelate ligase